MQVLQTPTFKRLVKKLYANQKKDLDAAILSIIKNPLIGEMKKGDLNGIQVYKFNMTHQLTLLAYTVDNNQLILTLLAIGSHENFYRDLKKN